MTLSPVPDEPAAEGLGDRLVAFRQKYAHRRTPMLESRGRPAAESGWITTWRAAAPGSAS